MKAVVWTTNTHKLSWVQQAFEESLIFRKSLRIEWMDVESQVASMPMSIEETMLWARNRAMNLIWIVDADLHLWIEWWAWEQNLTWLGTCLGNIAYIQDNKWNWYYWYSETVDIPPVIACQLEDTGRDLLDIMKEIYPNDDFISQWDVSWFLTQGKLSRQKLVYQSVVDALSQLLADTRLLFPDNTRFIW